jgi:putative PIN family toxin of toxin-antitoxin system
MWNVVLDTNILVSALWSQQGNPYKVVEMVFSDEIVLYYTDDIIEEYEEVLCRDKFGFSKDRVESLLRELAENGVLTEPIASAETFADETDRKFYDTAKANNATLITGNIKHYPKQPFVMTPFEFLQASGTTTK